MRTSVKKHPALLTSWPLIVLVILAVIGGNAAAHDTVALSDHQNAIENTCQDVESTWPECRMVFSTYLLQAQNQPLLGRTTCDNSCTFTIGLSCAGKIADCVSPCTSDPTSSQCLQCIATLGTCCNCLSYALGKVSNTVGQAVCNECPAAALQQESIKDPHDAIKKYCDPAVNPNCSFLTTYLYHDQSTKGNELQPMLGSTHCDGKCSWGKALKCAGKVARCVPQCAGGLTSKCANCVKNSGSSCCNCIAYGVGKASSTAGKAICSLCSSDASFQEEGSGLLLTSTGETCSSKTLTEDSVAQDPAPTVKDLVYTTAESSAALVPTSPNYSPHLTHVLGCSFYQVSCLVNEAKCGICKNAVPLLIKTGSVPLCDAACIGIVEAVGGGPEDPLADIVAAACPALCAYAFKEIGQSAKGICKAAKLC